ncbi:hypothetical protein SAMN05216223_104460 [Actinacidiphila yanglinensis]|uniref:Uncharacterized protein n=1 Tax=Actinacidiphila yanglinensis TaxID=310779 RepID=A0A1H5ZEI2_9ACTN|nr:hypothetical protein [Actinacidiphila yanglinensis]SEG34681.1 hypothetical protein SAMN05216223_104460 [Actinacidiphila yanglinensis]
MDGYVRSGADPLAAFGRVIPVRDSTLLNRLAGYMRAYEVLTGDVPDREIALTWLRETPAVVQKGLVEGIHLFHNNRPQVDRSS